jgi:hypothetical protein
MTGVHHVAYMAAPATTVAPARGERWLRAAKRARQLSWAALVWMSIEGIVGLIAGFEANSLSLLIWASSSFVEGLASMSIIWRFTGSRMRSAASERTAQKWVACSFVLLVPYFLYESSTGCSVVGRGESDDCCTPVVFAYSVAAGDDCCASDADDRCPPAQPTAGAAKRLRGTEDRR